MVTVRILKDDGRNEVVNELINLLSGDLRLIHKFRDAIWTDEVYLFRVSSNRQCDRQYVGYKFLMKHCFLSKALL